MGKRNCKSKYKSAALDSPKSVSDLNPKDRDFSSTRHEPNTGTNFDFLGSGKKRHSSDYFEVSDSPDNVHSPYHLHSSDHPRLVLSAELLDGTNFSVWLIAMIMTSLEAKNKLGFIDGSTAQPPETDPYFKIWCRCNSMDKSWLLNSVSKKIYTSILYIKNASDIWKDLHTRYHKSNLPRIYKLRQHIHSLRQGNLDLSSYHTQTQVLWEELSHIQITPRTVQDLLTERETNRVMDFLMGLNDSYENVRSRILMKIILPSLSEVYNLLDQDESQRSVRVTTPLDMSSAAFQVTLL